MLHHSHHWQTHGEPFYGDHILLQKLYETTQDEVDVLGEKLIGVSKDVSLTNYFSRVGVMKRFLDEVSDPSLSYIEVSYKAEKAYLSFGEALVEDLSTKGLLTTGLEQAIGNILDTHEGHLYLLGQRVKKL